MADYNITNIDLSDIRIIECMISVQFKIKVYLNNDHYFLVIC